MRLALVLLLCCLTAPVWAATTYYIAPGGTDTHTCAQARSAATPRRTLNGAHGGLACLVGGDTLVLGNGVYHEQLADYADGEHPGTTRPPAGLSWEQPTRILAATPRGATLDKPQPGHPYNHTLFFGLASTQYISVEGLVIDGRGHGACVWVGPSSHMRFQGNVIKNCGGNGIMGSVADDGSGCQDIQILENEIFNVATEQTGPPGSHAIYFTGNHSVARNNYIHAPCPFYGLHYTSEHGGLHSNLIENNRIVGCDQAGIFSQGSNTVIRNNLSENNCIGIYLSSASTKVLNNTIYGWHKADNCGDSYGIFNKSGGSVIQNNLVLQQSAGWAYVYAHETTHTVVSNLCDATGSNACQLHAAAGTVVMDGASGNLTLKASGPAVNTGTATADVPTDRLGVARPQGSASDIGAYESTSTTGPPADQTPPRVTLLAPSHEALVSGTAVAVAASAEDEVGVAAIWFLLNREPVGSEQTGENVHVLADSTKFPNGLHKLTAMARDTSGNTAESGTIDLFIYNGPTPIPPGPGTHPPLACSGALKNAGVIDLVCTPQPGGRR